MGIASIGPGFVAGFSTSWGSTAALPPCWLVPHTNSCFGTPSIFPFYVPTTASY